MKYLTLIFVSTVLCLPLQGCKWKDDFRERKQPYYLDYEAEPTLNMDSEQYVGDDVAREIQGEVIAPERIIPDIDELGGHIPYVPEHPAGVIEYDSGGYE